MKLSPTMRFRRFKAGVWKKLGSFAGERGEKLYYAAHRPWRCVRKASKAPKKRILGIAGNTTAKKAKSLNMEYCTGLKKLLMLAFWGKEQL